MHKLIGVVFLLDLVYAEFCEFCEENEICCGENVCCEETKLNWLWMFIITSLALMAMIAVGLWFYYKRRSFGANYRYQLVPDQVKIEEP